MKIVMILLCLLTASLTEAQTNSVYQLQFAGIDHNAIAMSDYKGKKIIVALCDAAMPNRRQLLSLDSLYRSSQNQVAVVVVPVNDFGAVADEQKTRALLHDSLRIGFPVAQISKATRSSGSEQHILMQWLTTKERNGHYDTDVKTPGELFVISEKGILYARLKEPGGRLLGKILAQAAPVH